MSGTLLSFLLSAPGIFSLSFPPLRKCWGGSNYEEKWKRLKANLLPTSPKKLLQKVPNRSCRAGAWFSLNRRWAAADRTNSELEQGLTPQPRAI